MLLSLAYCSLDGNDLNRRICNTNMHLTESLRRMLGHIDAAPRRKSDETRRVNDVFQRLKAQETALNAELATEQRPAQRRKLMIQLEVNRLQQAKCLENHASPEKPAAD